MMPPDPPFIEPPLLKTWICPLCIILRHHLFQGNDIGGVIKMLAVFSSYFRQYMKFILP